MVSLAEALGLEPWWGAEDFTKRAIGAGCRGKWLVDSPSPEVFKRPVGEVLRDVVHGGVGLMDGLIDFRGPFQTKDSMVLCLNCVSSYCGCDVGV